VVNFKPFAGPEEPRSVTAQDFAAEQLELRLQELEAGEAEEISKAAAEHRPLPLREGARPKPAARRHWPSQKEAAGSSSPGINRNRGVVARTLVRRLGGGLLCGSASSHLAGTRTSRSVPVAKGDGSRVRSGLAAGGNRIRTFGSPTDPLPLREQSASHDGLTVSRPGTEISNPSPSREESGANLTFHRYGLSRAS